MGAQSGIGDLTVAKSGESILFMPRDAQGAPLPISSIRNSDDVQVLQLVGTSQATSFTLGLNGVTTGPIPLQAIPPPSSFVWRATLPSAGSYDIGLSWGVFFGGPAGKQGTTGAVVEVISAGKLLGSATLDQSQKLDPATDLAVQGVGVFRAVGTYVFTGTDLEVRLSGPPDSMLLLAELIRVAPTGSTDPTKVGYIDPAPNHTPGSDAALEGKTSTLYYGTWTQTYFYTDASGWRPGFYGIASGTAGSAFPTVADVQTALNGLSNVTPGSILFSSPTSDSIVIQFTGAMGGQAWPSLVCSEPAIQVVHDGTSGSSVGGDFATATINGVAHTLAAYSFASGKPRMAFHLIQDAPAIQYQRYGEGLYQNLGYWNFRDGIGYGSRVGYATQAGTVASWQFQGLAGPAEFQVDITWPAGDPAADILQCVILDGTGKTLATVSGLDQTQSPSDLIDGSGVSWKSLGRFTLTNPINSLVIQAHGPGNPGKYIILDSVRLTRTSPDRGVRIQPGDQVLFHLPANYVQTPSGPVAAAAGVPVQAAPATRLPALPAVPKSMRLGFNCDFPVFWNIESCYSNIAVQAYQPIGLAQDAHGNPTRLAFDGGFQCGSALSALSVTVTDAGGRGFGVPTISSGVWVVQWTGPSTSACALVTIIPGTTVSEIVAKRSTTGLVNRRYFQVTSSSPASPCVHLQFLGTVTNSDGSYQCNVSNVAVYPPDINPDAPPHWRPSFLKKLAGVQCFRFMDMLATNSMGLSDFDHLPAQANFPLGYGGRTLTVPIASIGPPTPDPFSESVLGPVVRVTTKVPHGLPNGFAVALRTTDGSSLGQITSNLIDATSNATTTTSRDPVDPTDGYQGQYRRNMCRVIDDVTLQIGIECYSGTVARMTNTLTPANGILEADIAPNARMGPDDIADLCIATGLEPWVNVPWLATDDCVAGMARVLAARLPAGRVIHIEYGNEAWNYGFTGFGFCLRMAKLLNLSGPAYVPYYMTRMAQVHKIFRDGWTAAGRNPTDVRRVCGVQCDYAAGTTAPSLDFAIANGISFDELAPATYYSNAPASGALDDLLTRDQLLDLFAMNVQQSDLPDSLAAHVQYCRDALAKNPAQTWLNNVILVNYEGGPEVMTTSTMTANLPTRNHAVHRHPDFCEIELNHLQMLEDAGVKLFNCFTLYGCGSKQQWGVYEGMAMQPGTGDATLDLANINDYENLSSIKSETAAALGKWSTMIQQHAQPSQPTRPVKLVLRNGTALAYGMAAY